MRNALIKTLAASGIAAAAIFGASTPSFAAGMPGPAPQHVGINAGPGSQSLTIVPGKTTGCPATGGGIGCENRVSATLQQQQNLWNGGGAELGGGAANLVSSAVVGLPTLVLDLFHGVLHTISLGLIP